MQNEFFESMDRLLADICNPATVRQIEADVSLAQPLWPVLTDSGFLDLMVPESEGGSGLGWHDAWQVLFAVGRHGVALPLGQTIWGRSIVWQLGQPVPFDEALALSGFGTLDADGFVHAACVPSARLADLILVQVGEEVYSCALSQCHVQAVGGPGCFDANIRFKPTKSLGRLKAGTLAQGHAVLLAVQLAGAADRVLELTLNYANARQQFGKSIGCFQALQQQISEMAEHVYAMRMASQLAVQTDDWSRSMLQAALAKSQTSASAALVARVAHAVHGAIGITQEYTLQILTRKLYEWARSGGGEQYWAAHIGQAAFNHQRQESGNLLDFVREGMFGANSVGQRVA